VGSRGFRVTRRGRMGGNLATDKGKGQVEMVLGSVEGTKRLRGYPRAMTSRERIFWRAGYGRGRQPIGRL